MTPREIQEMRDNMKKVPEIKAKSETYHQQEAKTAEQLLQQNLQAEQRAESTEQKEIPETEMPKSTLLQRLRRWIVDN